MRMHVWIRKVSIYYYLCIFYLEVAIHLVTFYPIFHTPQTNIYKLIKRIFFSFCFCYFSKLVVLYTLLSNSFFSSHNRKSSRFEKMYVYVCTHTHTCVRVLGNATQDVWHLMLFTDIIVNKNHEENLGKKL